MELTLIKLKRNCGIKPLQEQGLLPEAEGGGSCGI